MFLERCKGLHNFDFVVIAEESPASHFSSLQGEALEHALKAVKDMTFTHVTEI